MTTVEYGLARIGMIRRRARLGLIVCGVACAALPLRAQQSPDPAQALPIPRLLTDVPGVSVAGTIPTTGDSTTTLWITPGMAMGDLRYYAATVESQYPLSAAAYPMDSLRNLKTARAVQWMERLRGASVVDPYDMELLLFAEAALRAGEDSAARRAIDARLVTIHAPLPRSFILAGAVNLFTEAIDDSVRLAARFAIAAAYAQELAQLRVTGLSTVRDSLNMVFRQISGLVQLVSASVALKHIDVAMQYTDQALASASRLDARLRGSMIQWYYPMQDAATLVYEQRGHAVLDTISQFQKVMAVAPALREGFDRAASLGQPAPPLSAHVWLNAPDSLYDSTPRPHRMDDHAVHLLMFGYNSNVEIADRMHRQFPSVHVLDMTEIDGQLNGELVPPSDEIDWLRTFLRTRRHATMPIGIWVGPKQPNKYGGAAPEPSPAQDLYHATVTQCVIVDRNGLIHDILPMRSRTDEAHIAAVLARLTAGEAAVEGHPQ